MEKNSRSYKDNKTKRLSNLSEFNEAPDLEDAFVWKYKDVDYVVSSFKKSCKIWKKESRERYFKPAVISFPIINLIRNETRLLSERAFSDHQAYVEYKKFMYSIPKRFQPLIVSLNQYQYLALEALYYIEDFEAFLKQEIKNQSLNYIVAVWVLSNAKNQPLEKRIEITNEAIYSSRRKVISSLLELPCKKTLLKMINNFDIEDIDCELISALYYFSCNEKLYTAFTKSRKLKRKNIFIAYYELPDWLMLPKIVKAVNQIPEHIKSLSAVFPPMVLNARKEKRKEILASLKYVSSYRNLEHRLAALTQKFTFEKEFPLPPFKGSKNLEAIDTGIKLKREGLRMHNCVAGYVDEVLQNQSYFYHWDDGSGEPATIQLSPDYNEIWFLEEALGFDNEELTEETLFKIKKELVHIMPGQKLPIDICAVAGTFYYEADKLWQYINTSSTIVLEREPTNEYDKLAIIVFLELNNALFKLGYIPRTSNAELARLMDKNQTLKADVIKKENENSFNGISLCISLVEPLVWV